MSAARAGVLTAAIITIVTFCCLAALDRLAVDIEGETVKEGLSRVARAAAGLVDGDLHKFFTKTEQRGGADYRKAIDPLVKFHKDIPEIAYLYTLAESNGQVVYVLDTASEADVLKFNRVMQVSEIMEPAVSESPEEDAATLAAIREGREYVSKKVFTDKYGTFMSAHAPIRDSAGKVVGLVGIDMDVREYVARLQGLHLMGVTGAIIALCTGTLLGAGVYRIRLKGLLAEAEARDNKLAKSDIEQGRQRLVQALGQITYLHRLEKDEILWDGECERILGHRVEEMARATDDWLALIHPDDREAEARTYRSIVEGEGIYDTEYRYQKKDGSYIWLRDRGVVSRGKDGRPVCVDGVLLDISKQKAAEQELTLLALVAEKTENAVVLADRRGRIEWVNKGFTRITEYALEDVIGRKPGQLLQGPETDREVSRIMREAIAAGRGFKVEVINYAKTGRKFWIAIETHPVRDSHGNITNFLAVESDITRRKEFEAHLIEAKESAEAAYRAKSEFLAVMSHEIRTPMNGMIGFANLLMETPLSELQKEYLESILFSGDSLLRILNDILEYSKMESGKMPVEHHPLALRKTIEDVVTLHVPVASAKDVDLRSEYASDLPENIVGDKVRLRQVLINLLSNAVKFTEKGNVSVSATGAKDDNGLALLRISVRDTGIGIPSGTIPLLFKPFIQADSSTTRKYGGTGLGLAICAKLVSLMGGSLQVNSTPGVGSEFYFTLPLVPTSEDADVASLPAEPLVPSSSPLNILVAEDNHMNQKVLVHMLRKLGHEIDVVNNGQECLSAIAGKNYDIVFMDIQMPEMDGYEATSALRAHGSTVWVVALTADAMPEDPLRCRIAGMNDYMSKPFSKRDLMSAIARGVAASKTEQKPS